MNDPKELSEDRILTNHEPEYWSKRKKELEEWIQMEKVQRKPKEVKWLKQDFVDQELYPLLFMLNEFGIKTEYSCAGVSPLDDPLEHSLYAYITMPKTKCSTEYVDYLKKRIRHRIIITYEPLRNRYDISSFFIMHNRSFCLILYYYTRNFIQRKSSR